MTLEQLARLQADFAAALNGSDETALEAWVTSGQARQGIDHYRRRLEAQQQRTLGLIYPKLREQLAPRVFAQLCEQYGHRHPSTEGDLGLFGDRLGIFSSDNLRLAVGRTWRCWLAWSGPYTTATVRPTPLP